MLYIPIDKDNIPYSFNMDVAGENFDFTINYNERFDFFTMDLSKDDEPVIYGEKITYGRALFSTFPDDTKTPQYPIIPFDDAGKENRVGWDNFMDSVFLYIGDPDE